MTIEKPSLRQLRDVAESLAITLSDSVLNDYLVQMDHSMAAYHAMDAEPDFLPKPCYARGPVSRPNSDENPNNAWYVKTDIKGAASGKLTGKRIAVKDNICVAGVPMMNGSSILEGYVPDIDATVVTRILDAGGTIVGKSHCEFYCLSGGSHTGAQGVVRHPLKPAHSAGGSSSGSAVLLATGEVDLALGGDQGGSARTPASYCGVVGLKPTWGLVPYTGAMPIELTIDHVGVMSRTVDDNALLLEVLAGSDGLDPRQSALALSQPYTEALNGGVKNLRIGVLKEGFGHHNSEVDVDLVVLSAAQKFATLGAEVREISIPSHHLASSVWHVIATEGSTRQMMLDNGHGFNWKGLYVTSLIDAHMAWRDRADELPDTVKYSMLLGQHMIRTGGGRHYAKAQNLARRIRLEFDDAFNQVDVLLMPTTPMKAPPLPPKDAPRSLYFQRAWENMGNTFPFDLTGHPALSVPCGMSEGLPIGMMLVGKHFDESTLYRAAHAFENMGDWREFRSNA